MAAVMNESGTAGPACRAAASPVSTKMPAPMIAPMPSIVRFSAPRLRLSDRSLVASASARSAETDFVAHRLMEWSSKGGKAPHRTAGADCEPGKLRAVVRRFPRDGHIVRVRLAQARRGDLHHLHVALELLDRRDAAIAHATTEAADHLIQHVGHRPLVR